MTKKAKNPDSKSKSPVPSVEKAFDVLELLAETADGLTMNEITDRLDRSMGELYRIVVYLVDRGYLEQDPETNKYSLTLGLFELSHRHDPTERIIRNAVPLMERFSARTHQSCHLGVLNRTNVLILASVQSPRPAGYSVRTGAMFPLHQTSTGAVILAFSAQSIRSRFLARVQKNEREDARDRLAVIYEKGFEAGESELLSGVRNIAAPIFDSRGIVAALTSGTVSQHDAPTSFEETVEEIRATALQLSLSLGFQKESNPFGAPFSDL